MPSEFSLYTLHNMQYNRSMVNSYGKCTKWCHRWIEELIEKCDGGKSKRRPQFWCEWGFGKYYEELIPVKVYTNVIGRSSVQNKHIYTVKSNCSPPKSWQCRQAQTKCAVFLFVVSLTFCQWFALFCMAIHMTSTDTRTWYNSNNRMTMMKKRRKNTSERKRREK